MASDVLTVSNPPPAHVLLLPAVNLRISRKCFYPNILRHARTSNLEPATYVPWSLLSTALGKPDTLTEIMTVNGPCAHRLKSLLVNDSLGVW